MALLAWGGFSMSDPMEPGWRPEYTGDTSLGNVGVGEDFGVSLYYLYRAGRNELPGVARTYSQLTSDVHGTTGYLRALFDVPGVGMYPVHLKLLDLRDQVHQVLHTTCLRMQMAGNALVEIASLYAATDEEATCEFASMLDDVENLANKGDPTNPDADNWHRQPPIVPEPPNVDDPPPARPADDGHLTPPAEVP